MLSLGKEFLCHCGYSHFVNNKNLNKNGIIIIFVIMVYSSFRCYNGAVACLSEEKAVEMAESFL